MSPSIVVSGLAWSTPDGRPLFSDLDLQFAAERTGLVGRNGAGKTTLLRLIAGELVPARGAVTVHGRIASLRQSLRVGADETIADLFGVTDALALLERIEIGAADADEIASADWTLDARIAAALAEMALDAAPKTPLAALSGGQRVRAGLAALLFAAPDFLLLDEPTNNLDREGRDALRDLLVRWRAGALVASHDRDLLEAMDAIVELTPRAAVRYGGGWSAYRARKALDLAAARHDLAHAERQLAAHAQRTQLAAERKARKDAAGARAAAKGGQPKILLGARKARAENTAGDAARVAERRRDDALAAAAAARARIAVLQPMAVSLAPTGLAPHRTVLRLSNVTAGHVPDRPVIADLSFTVTGPERIALTGPNGAGKTTLLSVIAGTLAPVSGAVRVFTPFVMLDQQVRLLDPRQTVRDNFARLNPGAGENACRAALARFAFRADAALQPVGALSGGQTLRAGLACVLGGPAPPPFLILDEPTNHLDLEALEAVEAGLAGYDGALMVVSHDEAFLAAIGVTRRLALPRPAEG
ncbi:MAG: ABC-F family ATP-binding cassette domain-containing protein [Hyphomonadaceae bacterium]|nr:ABC-F family ATP-binding cassette domain-containing protein [Hyphomonadaceae bacterium]